MADEAVRTRTGWRLIVGRVVAVIVLAAVLLAEGVYLFHRPWALGFVIALLAIGVAKAKDVHGPPWLGRLFERVAHGYVMATVFMFVAFFPIFVARFASDVVAHQNPALAVAVLVPWALLLYLALFPAWSEERRQTLLSVLRQGGRRAGPIVYGVALIGIAVIFFASLSWLLADRDWVRFGEAGGQLHVGDPSEVADFYLWQTLDAVPALGVNETLRWEQPLPYEDGRIGALVLAFKVTVLVPLIAMLSTSWRSRGRASTVDEGVSLLPAWFPRWLQTSRTTSGSM